MNRSKRIVIAAICLLAVAQIISASPVIKAKTDGEIYGVGDLVTVEVRVEENPGFNGLFFDLAYDGSILTFEGLDTGFMVLREVEENSFLYAHSDPATSTALGSHLIVSYSLKDPGAQTLESGTLVKIYFRLTDLGTPGEPHRFSFDDASVQDANGTEIATAIWQDSYEFYTGTLMSNAYISIAQPSDNEVFYTDTVEVDATNTAGAGNTVVLSNLETGYESAPIAADAGFIDGQPVPVTFGFNRIKATLKNDAGNTLADDVVTIYRSTDDKFVRITSPADHALLNTDMVEVRISCSFDNVSVNGLAAEDTGESDGGMKVFRSRIWLARGFNTITAEATSPEEAVYRDSITVYYQKDDSIFRFLSPQSGETFKSAPTTTLSIKGEIGSLYRSEGEMNCVTLRIVYRPQNPYLSTRLLLNDQPALLEETDVVSGDAQAPYMFVTAEPIVLDNLNTGEIEIIAYKNKQGAIWENEIHRFVYVDDSRLYIDLVQPNVFSRDILDTPAKLRSFNDYQDPVANGVALQEDGSFALVPSLKTTCEVAEFSNKTLSALVELGNGDLAALVNDDGAMKIYAKEYGEENWTLSLAREDMYGYTLCETGLGILVGVSNLFANDNSGLYLLQEGTLKNIVIGEPISHVQFIENREGVIYLYGNDYSHLYSFNLYSLEEEGGRLVSSLSQKLSFDNDVFIRQFVLSGDATTAVIRTSGNLVSFYQNLSGDGFRKVYFEESELSSSDTFATVALAEYTDGDYNTYLLVREDNTAISVMEEKSTHRLVANDLRGVDGTAASGLDLGISEELLGVGFQKDRFFFLTRPADEPYYEIKSGQVLFDTAYWDEEILRFHDMGLTIARGNLQAFTTRLGVCYLGLGSALAAEARHLYRFSNVYPASGTIAFDYKNDDVEGLSAFSFEIDPVWMLNPGLKIGFRVKEIGGSEVFGRSLASIQDFVDSESDYFSVEREYDAAIEKERVAVTFSELQTGKYLSFEIKMTPVGIFTPSLGNLTVEKKVPVRLPRAPGQLMLLPIHGWVYDPTVEKIYINEYAVDLDRQGSFSLNYPIHTSSTSIPVKMYCENAAHERTDLDFTVQLFDSVNGLFDIELEDDLGTPLAPDAENVIHTDRGILKATGKYYGLIGAIAGYELQKYDFDQEEYVLLRAGVFEKSVDETIDPAYEYLGTGYESGRFTDQSIRLSPRSQRLVLYVENPGGLRSEYLVSGEYPVVDYDLPEDQQEIVITNLNVIDLTATGNEYMNGEILVDKKIELDVYESAGPPYVFHKDFLIQGEIRSLHAFYDLKIKSLNDEATFENGATEIIVDVDESNRFQVAVSITMPENTETEAYDIAFIPTAPFLDDMKTGICLSATKSFLGTYIVPDFEPMAASYWSEAEKEALRKPLRIKFDRYVPEGAFLTLLVNYETTVSGELQEVNPGEGVYKVMEGLAELDLTGVRFGTNRIRWEVSRNGIISSSASGRPGMEDYLFTLTGEPTYLPTTITFPNQMQTYYDAGTLPSLEIAKDETTWVQVVFNGEVFWEDDSSTGLAAGEGDLKNGAIVQGRNYLSVSYEEKSGESQTVEYNFLYDTLAPAVEIASYSYTDDYSKLSEITAAIKEANLMNVDLRLGDPATYINRIPEVTYWGEDVYEATWRNLEDYSPAIVPTPANPLTVRVQDHSGKETISAAFEGLSDTITRPETPEAVDVVISNYQGTPYIAEEVGYEGRAHQRFYNAEVGIEDMTVTGSFRIDRPAIVVGDVTVGEAGTDGHLTLRATDKIEFKPGFSVAAGSTLNAAIDPNDFSIPVSEPVEFNHVLSAPEQNTAITFITWFRFDPEPYYAADTEYRRILTVFDDGSESIYLAYKDDTPGVPNDELLYVVKEVDGDPSQITVILGTPGEPFSDTGPDDWNIINLGLDKITDTIRLTVNDETPVSVVWNDLDYYDELFEEGAGYYYGDQEPYEVGDFSIAGPPFYINQIMSTQEALEANGSNDPAIVELEPHRLYAFDNEQDRTGSDHYELRTSGEDWFCALEDVGYEAPSGADVQGSLKASSLHKNLLDVTGSEIAFKKEDGGKETATKFNLNIISAPEYIVLEPVNPTYPGRYLFGNTFGNHGLENDPYFSISGHIFPDNPEGKVDATLVLRINSQQQSMKLTEGEFHFVYENTSGLIPDSVILYIETETRIKLSRDIIFSEGNYVLPVEGIQGIGESYASTQYVFQSQGTIEFSYKPLNANDEGFVTYPAVLFDSEYITIGSEMRSGEEHATYYVVIQDDEPDPDMIIHTNRPVRDGWQHIQLSYRLGEVTTDNLVYLYVDGELVEKREGEAVPQMAGTLPNPDEDNLFIGVNRGTVKTEYAEGYLDNLRLTNLYKTAQFVDTDPISYAFDDLNLTIEQVGGGTAADIDYILQSRDGFFREVHENVASVSGHGFDIPALESGPYFLKARMNINGHRYSRTYHFTKNDRPRFLVKSVTPLIVKGVESDIHISLDYEDSYLMTTEEFKYPGVAVRIEGRAGDSQDDEFAKTLYITQNFLDQNRQQWLQSETGQPTTWTEFPVSGRNSIEVLFSGIRSTVPIDWEVRPFYFYENFSPAAHGFDLLEPGKSGTISDAYIDAEIETFEDTAGNEIEYKIAVQVGSGAGEASQSIIDDLSIGYLIGSADPQYPDKASGLLDLNSLGYVELYYDDVLDPAIMPEYGQYDCILSLRYQGQTYEEERLTLTRNEIVSDISISKETSLAIADFSLLYLDKEENTAQLYLEYEANGLADLKYDLTVISTDTGEVFASTAQQHLSPSLTFRILNIAVPEGSSYVRIDLKAAEEGLHVRADLDIVNMDEAPDIIMTNIVPSLIAYNNVFFSWRGYHDGTFKPGIAYSYNFDSQGWSAPSPEWRQIELYDLAEGYHNFRVKAIYQGVESSVESVTFFVDINRPAFDSSKIAVEELRDGQGVLYAVRLTGSAGAIVDASLTDLTLNGEIIEAGADGSFVADNVALSKDGLNKITLSAYDKVGNFTDYTLTVANEMTEILFPQSRVRYAPATVVGRLSPDIEAEVEIYLADPLSEDRGEGDFSGWKRARLNEDRTFFIKDVFINPGTSIREAHTPLRMAVKVESGHVFYRDIDVWANELLRPIEIELSTHAVEGANVATEIDIHCTAYVDNVSSWSIDFDGDGIYDQVDLIDNPAFAGTHGWTHSYSSLGLIQPRVRVITMDGAFFSVSERLIIHERITQASHTMIADPIALSVLRMPDRSHRIFILAGGSNSYRIEVYEVGRNESCISNKLYTISLNGMGIENPVDILALDTDHIMLAANRSGLGRIQAIEANEFGNYHLVPGAEVLLSYQIRSIDAEQSRLFIGFSDANRLAWVPIEGALPVPSGLVYESPQVPHSVALESNLYLAEDPLGLLVSDYHNQRILRLSDSFKVLESFGRFGQEEGQFIKPARICAWENRIFVYDESRKDVQVFGPLFEPITRLVYEEARGDENYLPADFLDDLADIAVVAKEEGNLLFYYSLLLSRSSGKLAMLRLPQWEELRARVRNNQIVFLKDREVFTAKPDGADLKKALSSDSLPRIEGTLDYPALSPDGRNLVFTSRVRLYNGIPETGEDTSSSYAYDNLYVKKIGSEELVRIPLEAVQDYEIERPVFNSNGDKLIFSAKESGGRWQIYLYNLQTGGVVRLFESDENARFPYFSPDDRFVVFTTDYDGDEEVEIFDTENPSVRVSVSSNYSRDSFPVWSTIYPYEISNPDLDIESKIAFVSERDYHKGLWYCYVSRPSESDVRIVTETGEETGDDPDAAAIELTSINSEGDYPCFTGDGKSVVYEYFDGVKQILNRYYFERETGNIEPMPLPSGVRKPAGMKNSIANFKAAAVNGNEVQLSWTRYTDTDIFYTVRFKKNVEDEPFVQKKIFTQNGTTLSGLEMGVEYIFRVSIVENGEEAAASQWRKVLMPRVAARPIYQIDAENPYLVHLNAWKPDEETQWLFTWLIDNQEVPAQTSQDYLFEFGTSGRKTILLKATDLNKTYTSVSAPMFVDIKSDIDPVIEYTLADDSSYISLSAAHSAGSRIDWSFSTWVISGPGQPPMPPVTGSQVIVPLDGFDHKINVNLTLKRIPVTGQIATDTLEENIVVDLDFKDVKPVITYQVDEDNDRLFTFSGNSSLGNIDWYRAQWLVYADGLELHRESAVSTFAFEFPAASQETSYTVALTVPRRNEEGTETATLVVAVNPAPIQPVIDYEILTLEEGGSVVGAKILFSASGSKGSNIDFAGARWSVPVAGAYNEQPTQIGPTAIYNLFGIDDEAQVEVSLTLTKRGGTDAVTATQVISVAAGKAMQTALRVNAETEESSTGTVLILDVLSSSGPNIDWENTQWLIDGQYSRSGPVVRIDVPAAGEQTVVRYVCTLYRYGAAPLTESKEIVVGGRRLKPMISYRLVPGGNNNVFELSITDTPGVNIDWERTTWFIYDGNENVVQKHGARISHVFALTSEAMGYPVMVEMFYKGSTLPFVGYASIDVAGDELRPVITWDQPADGEEANTIYFSAEDSMGSNIDWAQAKWTFGDSSEAQYGPVAVHEYPSSDTRRSYKASLTLTRRSANDAVETKSAFKTVTLGSDRIRPVITARLYGDGYLVLSAEESEGRGLLLDRSQWIFEGQGDTQSLSVNMKDGKVQTDSLSKSNSVTIEASALFAKASTTIGGGYTHSATSYEDFKDNTESFSTQNSHVGAICRRYIGTYDIENSERDQRRMITVTLFVYRADADGGMDGRSITVNIDLKKARGGVKYE